MRNKLITAVVVLIVVIGVIIRIVGLNKSPPSMGFDEAALGYNAYSLMMTGKDEYGNILPLSLRSFNDYKPALYAYLSIPFIKIMGLNETSVRMVSAIAGIVSLIVLYFLLKKYIKNKYWLLIIFFILSFEPWRLHFSRNAFETNLSAMFFLLGSYCLLTYQKQKRWLWSLLFFGLSTYSYHSARLSVPLLLLAWAVDPLLVFKTKKVEWSKLWMIVAFLIISLPIFVANNSALLLTRFRQENVFTRFYPYAPKEILNPISSLYYFGAIVSGHIFSSISPINLNYRIYDWVKMSPQFIPGMGMLGWIEGIVFGIGFIYVVRRSLKSFKLRFLLYWMLAGIAPAAATWTWFHPLRSLNIYPAIEVITAIGIWQMGIYINSLIKNKFIKIATTTVMTIVILVTIIFTINNELLYSAYENYGEYQPGGYREGMMYLKALEGNYDKVIIDTPHAQGFIFLLFYQAIDPSYVQQFADIRPKPGVEGNLNFNFGKFEFRKIDWPKDKNLKRTLFWGSNTITRKEVEEVPGARVRMLVPNAQYDTAVIISTE